MQQQVRKALEEKMEIKKNLNNSILELLTLKVEKDMNEYKAKVGAKGGA